MIGALPRTVTAALPRCQSIQEHASPGREQECATRPGRALREPAPASLLARAVLATQPVVRTSVLPCLECLVAESHSTVAF